MDEELENLSIEEQNKRLRDEVERMGFELGDEILKHTKAKHEKRDSVALVEKWKAEADTLRQLLEDDPNRSARSSGKGLFLFSLLPLFSPFTFV